MITDPRYQKNLKSLSTLSVNLDALKRQYFNQYSVNIAGFGRLGDLAMKLAVYSYPDSQGYPHLMTPKEVVTLKAEFEFAVKFIDEAKKNVSDKGQLAILDNIKKDLTADKAIVDLLHPEDNLALPNAVYKVEEEKKLGLYAHNKKPRYPSYDGYYNMVKADNPELEEDIIFRMYIDGAKNLKEIEKNYTDYIKKDIRRYEYGKQGAPSNTPMEIRNTGDSFLIKDYLQNHGNELTSAEKFRLQMRLNATDKVDKIQADALKKMQKEENTSNPAKVTDTVVKMGNENVRTIRIDVKQKKGQSSTYGCWSVASELLLQSRGINNVTQENIRSYRPKLPYEEEPSGEMDREYNVNEPKVLMDMGDSIMAYAPNTMLHEVYIEPPQVGEQVDNDKYFNATVEYLKKTITHAITVDKSPIAIRIPGHFLTITGLVGNDIEYKNPSDQNNPNQTHTQNLEDFLKTYYFTNNPHPINISWISDIKLAKDKHTLYGVPSEYTYANNDGTLTVPPENINSASLGDITVTNRDGIKITRICGDEQNNIGRNIGSLGTEQLYSKEGLKIAEKVYLPSKLNYDYLSKMADKRTIEEEAELNDTNKNFYGLKGDKLAADKPDIRQKIDNNNQQLDNYRKNPDAFKKNVNNNNEFININNNNVNIKDIQIENLDEILNTIDNINKEDNANKNNKDNEKGRRKVEVPPKPKRTRQWVASDFDIGSSKGLYNKLLGENKVHPKIPPKAENNLNAGDNKENEINNKSNENEIKPPVVEEKPPVVEEKPPVVEKKPPVVEEKPKEEIGENWQTMSSYAALVDENWEDTVKKAYSNQKTNFDKVFFAVKFSVRVQHLANLNNLCSDYAGQDGLTEEEIGKLPFANPTELREAYDKESELQAEIIEDIRNTVPGPELMLLLGMLEANYSEKTGRDLKQFMKNHPELNENQAKYAFSKIDSDNKNITSAVGSVKLNVMMERIPSGLELKDVNELKRYTVKELADKYNLGDRAVSQIEKVFTANNLPFNGQSNAYDAFLGYAFATQHFTDPKLSALFFEDQKALDSNILAYANSYMFTLSRTDNFFMQGKNMYLSTCSIEEKEAAELGIEQINDTGKFTTVEVTEWGKTPEAKKLICQNRANYYNTYLTNDSGDIKDKTLESYNLENDAEYKSFFPKTGNVGEKNYEDYIALHTGMNAYRKGEDNLRSNLAKALAAKVLGAMEKPFDTKQIHLFADYISKMDSFKKLSFNQVMDNLFDKDNLDDCVDTIFTNTFKVTVNKRNDFSDKMKELGRNMMSAERRSNEYVELVNAVTAIGEMGGINSNKDYTRASERLFRAIVNYTNNKMSSRTYFDGRERFDNAMDALSILCDYAPGMKSIAEVLTKKINAKREVNKDDLKYVRLTDFGLDRAKRAKEERAEIDSGVSSQKQIENRRKTKIAADNHLPLHL